MFHKILVALDESDTSRQVFDEAIALAQVSNAAVMLLHVLSPMEAGYPDFPVFPSVDGVYPILHDEAVKQQIRQWEKYEQQGWEQLKTLTTEATNAGVTVDFTQHPGSAGPAICALAQSWNADLIMMGRRGRRGFSELFLGSVSNYVTHHATCSVLIVQGTHTEAGAPEENTVAAVG